MRLRDKSAIITGAASGIGKEIARRFAVEGATVIVADLLPSSAEATAAEFTSAGHAALAVAMDVSDEVAVEAGVAAAIAAYGKVDILVSNAGRQHSVAAIEDLTTEQFDATFDVGPQPRGQLEQI